MKQVKNAFGILFLHFDPFYLLFRLLPPLPLVFQILLEFLKIFLQGPKVVTSLCVSPEISYDLCISSHTGSLASSFLLLELCTVSWGLGCCFFVFLWFWRLTMTEGEESTWD